MKRDLELIRKILLAAEAGQLNAAIHGYSDDELKYHRKLVIDAGLADGKTRKNSMSPTEIPYVALILGVTPQGHDFIDAIRLDSNWSKVKSYLASSGAALSIELAKDAVGKLFSST